MAAPVFDHTGSVVGALGTSVPEIRMDDARGAYLGSRVRDVAWQLSETLGATPEQVARTVAAARPPGEEGPVAWIASGAAD